MIIGISFSGCLKDLLEGEEDLVDVSEIITGTRYTPDLWEKVIAQEKAKYTGDPKKQEAVENLIRELVTTKRITQPRLDGLPCPSLNQGKIWFPLADRSKIKRDPVDKDGNPIRPLQPKH